MKRRGVKPEEVRQIYLSLPGVEEGTSYGTPAFRVSKKLIARFWRDGKTLVVRVGEDQQLGLVSSRPDVFFLTDHYRGHPLILVKLSTVTRAQLEDLAEASWEMSASKGLRTQRRELGGP